MSLDNDDSLFEEALRSDLPSADQQDRLRKRLLAVGLSAGSGLAATSTASAAQAGFGATVIAKVAALSWPVTLGLAAAVAAPIVALPIWLAPAKTSSAPAQPKMRPVSSSAPVVQGPAPMPNPASTSVTASVAARPAQHAAGSGVVPALHAEPNSATAANSAAEPAQAAAFVAPSNEGNPRAPVPSTLAAETELLDRAFADLNSGHQSAAAELIAEHERRFPNGLLRKERERARARIEQDLKGE